MAATCGDSPRRRFAGTMGEPLVLARRLDPPRGTDKGFGGRQCRDRRQQEGRGGLLGRGIGADRPDRDSLGNPEEDLHADAKLEFHGDREPLACAKKGLCVRQPDAEQLPEYQARACRRIDSRKAQSGSTLVLDLPGLDGQIRRRAGFVLVAHRDAPEGRNLLVLHLGYLSGAPARRERAAGDEVMHRGHSRARLRRAARAAAWVRARLLVLAPPSIEPGEKALPKRAPHFLAETERRSGLDLAQQADAPAYAAPKLVDVDNAGRVALCPPARGAGSG